MTLHTDMEKLATELHTKGQAEFVKAITAPDETTKTAHKYRAHTYQEAAQSIRKTLHNHQSGP